MIYLHLSAESVRSCLGAPGRKGGRGWGGHGTFRGNFGSRNDFGVGKKQCSFMRIRGYPPRILYTSGLYSVIYADIFAATYSWRRSSLQNSLSNRLTGGLEPRGQKPGEEGRIVSIVRFSGLLICKSAPRNFRLVFNELMGLAGFWALDRSGVERWIDPGVRPGVVANVGPGSEVRNAPGSLGRSRPTCAKDRDFRHNIPPKAGSF